MDNLLYIQSKITQFLSGKNFYTSQVEKKVGRLENPGFADAVFEGLMKKMGWKNSEAWCAYYVKLILMQMFSFDREWLEEKKIGGGAVNNYQIIKNANELGDKRYITFTNEKYLKPGDVFVLRNPGSFKGHTGIITDVLDKNKKIVITLEGNTNFTGTREGDKTEKLQRVLEPGTISNGQIVVGFYRRNFTNEEIKNIVFDEEKQTFIMVDKISNLPTLDNLTTFNND